MYSVSFLFEGTRVWATNKLTGTRYFKTKTAYRKHLAMFLQRAKRAKSEDCWARVEVEAFFDKKPIYYITII